VRMACGDMFATRWVPQAGFSVNPGRQWTLKANAAMGYRNPSFRELYLYRMANPDLQPERMMNYEIQIGKRFSRYLTADATVYLCRGTDMIQTVDFLNQNTGRFTNKGIELSASSHPLDNLTLSLTYSYLHTSLSNLTGAPTHQYFIGADWTPLRGLDLNAELRGISGLFVSADIHRQSYALLNLRVSYAVCRYVSLFTRLENITDARYVINRGYPMPGFTAMGGFRATIDFPRQTKR
ncbi:MAG: TonB-dependent receptor, partial [Muribaculaceae bacterium]|nr:TonB-dependent receptor [Muribaculaceae bacterium]